MYFIFLIIKKTKQTEITKKLQQKPYNSLQLEIQYQAILVELYQASLLQPNNYKQLKHKENKFKSTANLPFKILQKLCKKLSQFLEKVYIINSQYIQTEDEQYWPYAQNLKMRIFVTFLQLSVQFSEVIDMQEWLHRLIENLKLFPEYLPEVFGKLSGCKNPKQFKNNFNEAEILEQNNKDMKNKAELIDIASSWLIIAGEFEHGLKCKQLAVDLWQSANSLQEYSKCKKELQAISQNNEQDLFCIKLKKIKLIVERIYNKIDGKIISKQMRKRKEMQFAVKKAIESHLINVREIEQKVEKVEQSAKKSSKSIFSSLFVSSKSKSTSKSILKSISKSSKLEQYSKISQIFYQKYYIKQKNEQITDLIGVNNKSKFIRKNYQNMEMRLNSIKKLFSKLQREGFEDLVQCWNKYKYQGDTKKKEKSVLKLKSGLKSQREIIEHEPFFTPFKFMDG